ncbi:unnamed protein product [Calicophoron daubneyi]|uniref:Uncharacterized protein n=1 Tax=Calicophoron daubneyi TaxID=300641 RepID=A0AAV2T1J9_CALDB
MSKWNFSLISLMAFLIIGLFCTDALPKQKVDIFDACLFQCSSEKPRTSYELLRCLDECPRELPKRGKFFMLGRK